MCSPSGDFLSSINSLNPEAVIQTLETALRLWRQLPETASRRRGAEDLLPAHRWETSYPDDGLVLVSTNRDLIGDYGDFRRTGDRWNRDHVWFSAEEARGWLPEDLEAGVVHEVPDVLARRLAQFHFLDNVRGQTLPFAAEEVRSAEILATIVERSDQTIRLEISGATTVEADGPWLMGDIHWKPPREFPRSMVTQLLGHATFDLDRAAFTAFEFVAISRRRGYTQNNARGKESQEGTIGFVFMLAGDTPAERVPPAFIDLYDVDWVRRPSGN